MALGRATIRQAAHSHTNMTDNDLGDVAVALAKHGKRLDLIERALCGFVEQTCKYMSVDRGSRDWARIEGESRTKDHVSVKRALDDNDLLADRITELDDLVGVRAVVLLKSDADDLATAIVDSSALKLEQVKRKPVHDKDTGYRAIHVKGRWPSDEGDIGCEIQIRTEVQDAWAVVSHGGLYKPARTQPPAVTEIARVQADHLAVIDEAFMTIDDLVKGPKATPVIATVKAVAEVNFEVLK